MSRLAPGKPGQQDTPARFRRKQDGAHVIDSAVYSSSIEAVLRRNRA